MKLIKSLTFLTLLNFCTLGFAAYMTPGIQLQNVLKNTFSIQAGFTQKSYNGRGRLLQTAKGSMAILRPGRFRWDIKSPRPMLMISQGKNLWIYEKRLKQATVQPVKKAIGSNPARILSGAGRALTNYFIVQYNKGWYSLKPRYSGSNIKLVRLQFRGKHISQMRLYDKLGQRSYLSFYNVRINQRIPASRFQFRPPKGVDIIRQTRRRK